MTEQPCDLLTATGYVLLWLGALASVCGGIILYVWRW